MPFLQPLGTGARFRLAGHQHLAVWRGWARRLHVFGEVLCLLDEIGRAQAGRVEIDRQHAVGDARALAAGNRPRRAGADQAAGQNVAHERQARALVLAERAQRAFALRGIADMRALDRSVKHARIAGYLPVRADQRVVGHRLAAIRGHQHLALGHQRGGEIQQHRNPAVRRRDRDADRVGGEAPAHAAERRHQLAELDVDEVERHQPGGGRALAPVADATEMPDIAQPDHRDAALPGLADAEIHRLLADRLAEPEIAVDDGVHRGFGDDADRLPGAHEILLDPQHVARHADDAVAVVAGEIGRDQVAGGARRLGAGATGGGENVGDKAAQLVDGDRDRGLLGHVCYFPPMRAAGARLLAPYGRQAAGASIQARARRPIPGR